MQHVERDLFGNPIEASDQKLTAVIQTADFENADSRTASDDWRARRDIEEPERWDGMS